MRRRAGPAIYSVAPLALLACTLLLAACGLTPVIITSPAEATDGTFRWIDAGQPPPAGYVPVIVTRPGTPPGPAICRALVPTQYGHAYHTGELAIPRGMPTCQVAVAGRALNVGDTFQQLWAIRSAAYEWLPLADAGELRPLVLTKLWRTNRLPLAIGSNATGHMIDLWAPCAIRLADGWHAGTLPFQGSEHDPNCYFALGDREVAAQSGIYALYAPLDDTKHNR